ncbi:MAG: hypothetical protein LBI13_02430 [Streptococcaceae bacterium]|jgi:hypothetical protein|nr:hypothetical protein [Streptococcaceae bacterium]
MIRVGKKINIYYLIKNLILITVCFVMSLNRIKFGSLIHYQIQSKSNSDDRLLILYSSLGTKKLLPPGDALVKNMAFSKFLEFNRAIGWNFAFTISLLWILVAIVAVIIFRKINSSVIFNILVFAFFLYFPSAFDDAVGVRVYRNMIIVPTQFLFIFGLLGIFITVFFEKSFSQIKLLIWSIFLSFNLFFSYYLKEDGLWTLLLALGVIGVCIGYVLVRVVHKLIIKQFRGKFSLLNSLLMIIVMLFPLITYKVGTDNYKAQNLKNFGVAEINTRTEGEAGRFLTYLYKVKVSDRSSVVWAPRSAIKKVIEASPTLKNDKAFGDRLLSSEFGPKTSAGIAGDFMSWNLRGAWNDSKGAWNDKEAERYFSKVNAELEKAFETGTLKKDSNRIQISSSMGGDTQSEIEKLYPQTQAILRNNIMFDKYAYTAPASMDSDAKFIKFSDNTFHFDIFNNGKKSPQELKKVNNVINFYKIIAPVVVMFAIFGMLLVAVDLIFRIINFKDLILALVSLVIFGGGLGVSFAIAWFVNFLNVVGGENLSKGSYFTQFYGVEGTGLLYVGLLIAVAIFFKLVFAPLKPKHK